MTVREALAVGRKALEGHGTDTPHLDTSLLLAYGRGSSREKLYMELGEEVSPDELSMFRRVMERRISGEPVAWILGRKEFWGLDFRIGPGVLCPRPDSEVLVETALEIMDKYGMTAGTLHDCCCGPGTIAISLAVERPEWTISGSDISGDARHFFMINNQVFCNNRAGYLHTNLMDGVDGPFDIIVSNPPYLTPEETAERVALGWKEPVLALDGGGIDGLEVIRSLVPGAAARIKNGGYLLLEANPLQMPEIRKILSDTGFVDINVRCDLAGLDRVITGCKAGNESL
jgi:release factor glutamine methyltransferase